MNSINNMESYLANNFPYTYLKYEKIQLSKLKSQIVFKKDDMKDAQEIFDILVENIRKCIKDNCDEIVSESVKEYMSSDKFKKMILNMMIGNSDSTGGTTDN